MGWWQRTLAALVTAAGQVAIIAAVIICAGIVVGVFNITGLGVKLTSVILWASGGTLWIALLGTTLSGLVLRMELPTTAAYVICVAAPWLPVAGNALGLAVGLFGVPLAFIAQPALLQLAAEPVPALAAMAQIALGLLLISFAVIGGVRRPWIELARIAALPAGLPVIFRP